MSAHVEELGRNEGEEEASERSERPAGLNLRGVRARTRNPLGDSNSLEFLVRPALPGRKPHRSWSREEVRGRQLARTEQDEGRGANSESDLEPGNMADLAEGSSSRYNNEHRTHDNDGNRQSTNTTRMQASETFSPEDPFWVEVWSGTARSPQAMVEVRNRGNEEEEGDAGEGGSGVQEVQGQTSELLLPTVGSVERRLSKREKNRMRCLRRRQRKRERWRQLQESQQVKHMHFL